MESTDFKKVSERVMAFFIKIRIWGDFLKVQILYMNKNIARNMVSAFPT